MSPHAHACMLADACRGAQYRHKHVHAHAQWAPEELAWTARFCLSSMRMRMVRGVVRMAWYTWSVCTCAGTCACACMYACACKLTHRQAQYAAPPGLGGGHSCCNATLRSTGVWLHRLSEAGLRRLACHVWLQAADLKCLAWSAWRLDLGVCHGFRPFWPPASGFEPLVRPLT